MKKYQLWLERKTYSQHLTNLMRIKLSSSEQIMPNTLRPKCKMADTHPVSLDKSSQFLSARELSYIITARQLQSHKLRLVRSNQIVRENQQIVKRLHAVKPSVCNKRPVDHSHYKLKRQRQRANEQMSTSLKDKKYKNFQKDYAQWNSSEKTHKLTITLHDLPIRLAAAHQTSQFVLELITPLASVKSKPVNLNQLMNSPFEFSLNQMPPATFTLRVQHLKKLQRKVVGDFVVSTPKEGQIVRGFWDNQTNYGSIEATVQMSKTANKFTIIKRYKA